MNRFSNRARLFTMAVLSLLFMAASTQSAVATDLSGCWQGSWRSCTTGHEGPLSASFCAIGDSHYRVEFRGRFFKILPFRYSVMLNIVSDDGETVVLAGSSYLGRIFGTFHYQATATEGNFEAHYQSCDDQGYFSLCRTCTHCGH